MSKDYSIDNDSKNTGKFSADFVEYEVSYNTKEDLKPNKDFVEYEVSYNTKEDLRPNKEKVRLVDVETKIFSPSSVRILREAKEELDRFDNILNSVIKSKNHLTIEKSVQTHHENNVAGHDIGDRATKRNDEWWVVSFLFPECLSEDSMGTSIIKNIDNFNKMLSPRYPFCVVGLDNNNSFNHELFNFMCDHFSKISDFEWDGETTLLTVRYKYTLDDVSMMNKVDFDFNKVCIHQMDSLVRDGTYINYKKIIVEMNSIIKRSKTAKDVFRELNKIKLEAKGKIIIKSLFNAIKAGAWAKAKELWGFIF